MVEQRRQQLWKRLAALRSASSEHPGNHELYFLLSRMLAPLVPPPASVHSADVASSALTELVEETLLEETRQGGETVERRGSIRASTRRASAVCRASTVWRGSTMRRGSAAADAPLFNPVTAAARRLDRRLEAEEQEDRFHSASKIQALRRGRLARWQVAQIIVNNRRQDASSRIQRIVRGRRARQQLERDKATSRIQSLAR